MIAVNIIDPREQELPNVGFIELKDAESGESIITDTSNSSARKEYSMMALRQKEERSQLFRSTGVDEVIVNTQKNYVEPIIRFFRIREKRI